MSAAASTVSMNTSAPTRQVFIRNAKGDALGANFTIPKSDFARFLGYQPPSKDESSGKAPVSGERVLELALQREFNRLGIKSMDHGNAFRNIGGSMGAYDNQPGRAGDNIRNGMDAVNASVELNRASNMAYLELQYKFEAASKSFGTISNLMKARSEATRKAISEVR